MDETLLQGLMDMYKSVQHELKIFMSGIAQYIGDHPDLLKMRAVHSVKSRLKDERHLLLKLQRKFSENRTIDKTNFFNQITDLAGVRILHLFQADFENIDRVIRYKISAEDWVFGEKPKAYTWDPEAAGFFKSFDLTVSEKPTAYTSVHYLIKPRSDSKLTCEVQVRTLFEEIWGEVDHQINYPVPSSSIACREQIKVLSKIVGAGSRLLDSLERAHKEHQESSGKVEAAI